MRSLLVASSLLNRFSSFQIHIQHDVFEFLVCYMHFLYAKCIYRVLSSSSSACFLAPSDPMDFSSTETSAECPISQRSVLKIMLLMPLPLSIPPSNPINFS